MSEEIKEETFEFEKEDIKSTNYDTVVCGGGAMKSFFISGAIQYAVDNFLLTDVVNFIGTSGGAIILFLLIIGYTPVEIVVSLCCNKTIEKINNFDFVSMINGMGATSFLNIYEDLEKLTLAKIGYIPTLLQIKDNYNKTFICVTYNETEETTEYLSYENYPSLSCLIAIRMSCNLPFIFERFKYGGSYYLDGGLTNNFAIDKAFEIGNKILGIRNKSNEVSIDDDRFNIINQFHKLLSITLNEIYTLKVKNLNMNCIDIIEIDGNDNSMFNFGISTIERLNMFSEGYQQMKTYFEK